MALNTPYRRINITTGMPNQSQIANDPWGSLGTIIGTVLGNEAYERGVKKGTDEILSDMAPKKSEPAPQDIIDQAMTLSVGGNTVGEKDVKKAEGGEGKGAIKPEIDHGLLKYGYLMDKYKDNPNPVSDAITTKNIVQNAEIGLANANMDYVPEAEFRAQVMKKLMADGRNAAQREAIWENIQPIYNARKKEYDDQKAMELVGLYNKAVADKQYDKAEEISLLTEKYNPSIAKYLQKNNISHKDIWTADLARQNAAIKAANAIDLEIKKQQIKNTFGGGGSGVKDSTQLNAANTILETGTEDGTFSSTDVETAANTLKALSKGERTLQPSTTPKQVFEPKPAQPTKAETSDFVKQAVAAGKSRGLTVDQLITKLKSRYGEGPWVDELRKAYK